MGAHRTTIRRKKPLTHVQGTALKRRDAIRFHHTELKSPATVSNAPIPLSIYQQASSKGQDIQRGGDSSKVLVQWLKNSGLSGIRVLEVGCLEVDNAIGKYVHSQNGVIRRIDLKSRDPQIEEQDFMTLPVPNEKYDLISLSLVLNFVSTPQGRYAMLKRTTDFMRQREDPIFPALFVVLPLPCVGNSRYLTRDHFLAIMESLGYSQVEVKETRRMAYWLFRWNGQMQEKVWRKKIISDGGGRNNFAICS